MNAGFYERLFRFFSAYGSSKQAMSPIWSGIFEHHHKPLAEALLSKNTAAAQAILESGKDCLAGIQGATFANSDNKLNQELETVSVVLGLRSLQNPQQPFELARMDSESLLADLEAAFKTPARLAVPWLSHDGALCSYRYPTSAYMAGSITMYWGLVPHSVLEIGPGFGMLGILLKGLGCQNYSVVDLPVACVIAAWVFACLLGEDSVWFCGEPEREAYLRLFTPETISDCRSEFCAVVNSDSFPEIPYSCQDAYIKMAERLLAGSGFIYSVNQESPHGGQRSISTAIQVNSLFRPVIRKLFPLRQGYLEEIFIRK